MAESFGARLRECRLAAGMSMGELARRINYSKGYLSKIENDQRQPNATLARLCDGVLDTGGELSALVLRAALPELTTETTDDEVWVMSLDETGVLRFRLERRQVLAGAGAMLGFALARNARPETDERTVAGLRAAFDQYRQLGQQLSPAAMLGPVIAQVHTLRTLAMDNPEPVRSTLLRLASRVAEYAGWMSQEAGDEQGALWWTRRAVTFAEAGHDRQLASYALVREAEVALYRQDAINTINLARRAQAGDGAGPRVLGLAARCEAQGLALAGDLAGFQRAMDRATECLSVVDVDGAAGPVLGSSTVADHVSLARGWALCDLGRLPEAVEVLDREVAGIPATRRRTRSRFGARRALAHACNGDIDQACVAVGEVLDDVAQVDSATVRIDLRQLARTLSRWHNHSAVRETYPELMRALNQSPVAG
jgi:transcriptional regulator with XRE-family HTH domain